MSVLVLFPDGTQRQVMAELRLDIHVPGHAATGRFVQCPINADPLWKYVCRNGRWMARPRFGSAVKVVTGDPPAWWDGIASMADDEGSVSCKDPIGPHLRAA